MPHAHLYCIHTHRSLDMSIHSAAKEGDIRKVTKILCENEGHKNLKLRDDRGYLPLHVAVQNGQQHMAKLLLKKGADEYAQTAAAFKTPLHIAAGTNNMFFVHLLDTNKTKLAIKARDVYGYTPLHVAVRAGDRQAVATLFEKGADIEAKDKYGRTALHHAVQKGAHEIVDFLLNREANVYTRDKKQNSVLHSAGGWRMYVRLNPHYPDFWHEDNLEENCNGQTPLHLAVERGDCYTAEDMCERGAIPTQEDNHGHTPLQLALKMGHEEMIRCLEHYAELQSEDPTEYYFDRKRV